MIFRHSLRSRIIITFGLFGALLGTIYGLVVFFSLLLLEDEMVNNRLRLEMNRFMSRYAQNKNEPLPDSPFLTSYIGTSKMPDDIRSLVRHFAFKKNNGIYDIPVKKKTLGGYDYHIAIHTLPGHTEPLYLIYDVSTIELIERRVFKTVLVLIGGVVLITGLGVWIGMLTSHKIIAPVVKLAKLVNNAGPENLPRQLSDQFFNDEVGILAKALENAMQRVNAFISREHMFVRDVSHELRTPVTVIKGAIGLLDRIVEQNRPDAAKRVLKRIERSADNMTDTIETFLLLAREEAIAGSEEKCPLLPVVEDVIEQHRHLIDKKPIRLQLTSEATPRLPVTCAIIKIIIANLIQNSFHYTLEGHINITIHSDRIVISDTGVGIAASDLKTVLTPYFRGELSQGFGIGLSIVKRLCDRLGWCLEIQSDLKKGTEVLLIFEPTESD